MNQPTVNDHIQRAELLLSQSKAEEAKAVLIELLNTNLGTGYIRYLLGVAYSITQEHERAIAQYDLALLDKSLEVSDAANALSNKGVALEALNHEEKALAAYESALTLEPKFLRAAFNAGNASYKLRKFTRAEHYFRTVLATNPDNTLALLNLANCLFKLERYPEAAEMYAKLILLEKDYLPSYIHYGNALLKQGLFEEAMVACNKALEAFPDAPEATNLKSSIFIETHRYQEALDLSTDVIRAAPNMPEGYFNLGEAMLNLNRYDQAVAAFRQAIALNPEYPEAFFYLGCAHVKNFNLYEGELAYKRSIQLNPNLAEAHHNLGLIYNDLNQSKAAIDSLKHAIALKPDYVGAIYDLGNAFSLCKLFKEAYTEYKNALKLKPDTPGLKGDLLHLGMKMCNWREQKQLSSESESGLMSGLPTSSPFVSLHFIDRATPQLRSAELFSKLKFPAHKMSKPPIGRAGPIRLGYLSCDFRDHPVTYLTTGLIESHNRNEFTVIGFDTSLQSDTSDPGMRIHNAFDQVINIGHISDNEAADRIKKERIDILIDLTGHTQGGRTGICAYSAAPIQISYLGYPGSMGAPYYDYIVGDPTIVPEVNKTGISEKILYLPECFQANDQNRKIISASSINDFGLPENKFIFASFNQPCKITPVVFAAWMAIMQSTPESVLWLFGYTDVTISNLLHEAKNAGINPDRLIFANLLDYQRHLGRYAFVDLVLDTFPFNGGTTTSDALWGGAPVITLAGEAYASRMSASLLHNLNLDELITHSLDEYQSLAIDLASNSSKLKTIRAKLKHGLGSAPVFDTLRFTKHFESGLNAAVERCRQGLDPDHIYVKQLPK